MTNEHSEVGGSAAHRFIPCSGSVRLSRGLPNPDTEWSEKGHRAHEAAAFCLRFGGPPMHEDAWAIQEYVDLVNQLRRDFGASPFVEYIEHWFHRPEIDERFKGTIDFALARTDFGIVLDYKHGEGVPVVAVGNEQLLYYVLEMVLRQPSVKEWRLGICQPRAGGVSWWRVSRDDILNYLHKILKPALLATLEPDAPLVPGKKQCQFCPAKAICPALAKQEVAVLEPASVPALTDEQLDYLYSMLPTVRMRIKALEGETLRRAMNGVVFENAKLVESKTDRQWPDDVGWYDDLPEGAWTDPELLSPAQMEKQLGKAGKAFAAKYAIKPKGYPTLAPVSDTRHRIAAPTTNEIFDMKALDALDTDVRE